MDALERENRELSNSIQKWWKKIGHEFERRSDQRKNEIRSAQGYNGRNPSIGNSKKWDSFDPNKLDTGTFSPLCKFWKVHARITPEIKLINDWHVRNPDDTFRIMFCIIHVLYIIMDQCIGRTERKSSVQFKSSFFGELWTDRSSSFTKELELEQKFDFLMNLNWMHHNFLVHLNLDFYAQQAWKFQKV